MKKGPTKVLSTDSFPSFNIPSPEQTFHLALNESNPSYGPVTSTPRYEQQQSNPAPTLQSSSLPNLESADIHVSPCFSKRHKSRSLEIHGSFLPVETDRTSTLKLILGLPPYKSSFNDIIATIKQLQEKVSMSQVKQLLKNHEVESLKQQLQKVEEDLCMEMERSKKAEDNVRQLGAQVLNLKLKARKRRLKSASLPDTLQNRKVSTVTTADSISPSQSLRSASWDSVGAKEEIGSDRRPSFLSEVVSEDLEYNSDFENTLQEMGIEDDPKYLKQKILILERLLKESTSLHCPSVSMSGVEEEEYVSRSLYNELKLQCQTLNRQNEQLLSEHENILANLAVLQEANDNLKFELEQLGVEVPDNESFSPARTRLIKQLSLEDTHRIFGGIIEEEEEEEDDEEDRTLEGSPRLHRGSMDASEISRSMGIQSSQEGATTTIQAVSHEEYEKMVDHYDNVLRRNAIYQDQCNKKIMELEEANSNLKKILTNTVGVTETATSEQIDRYRRASRAARVSAIQGTAQLPLDLNKDQLITQLTNDLSESKNKIEELKQDVGELLKAKAQLEEHLKAIETERDILGDDIRNSLMTEVESQLNDKEFLKRLVLSKKEEDPTFIKQILSEIGVKTHLDENDEDLEFKLKQREEIIKVMEDELRDAYDHRNGLEGQLKDCNRQIKTLGQYKYIKDSVDVIVNEYCYGLRHTKKPEMEYEDENLNLLVNTLYEDQKKVKQLYDEVKILKNEVDRLNDEDKSIAIERLQKQLAKSEEQALHHFEDIKKFKGRIHDLDSENSQKGNEITDLMGMLEQYDEDIKKYRSQIDQLDTMVADKEDELEQRKRELSDEIKKQKGAKIKNLQLHSQVWIQKNRFRKLEKEREELLMNNENLKEEVEILKEKLEAANIQMVEQKKTSRRISSILKPGTEETHRTGKDAIIADLKEALKRQELYNAKQDDRVKNLQEKIQKLEIQLMDLEDERDNAKADLERSFSQLDGGSENGMHDELKPVPTFNFESINIMDVKDEESSMLQEAYDQLMDQFKDCESENEQLASRNRKLSTELDREKMYTESVEEKNERLLITKQTMLERIEELEAELQGRIKRSNHFDTTLPSIEESIDESLYEMSDKKVQELLDRIQQLEEELAKERSYIEHLEEQNENFRILLSEGDRDLFSTEELEDLQRRYSETKQALEDLKFQLKEKETTCNELKARVNSYREKETEYMDSIEEYERQLETSLIKSSEVEVKFKTLEEESKDLEDLNRRLMNEQSELTKKNIMLQEKLAELSESKGGETDSDKERLLVERLMEINELKQQCSTYEEKINSLESQVAKSREMVALAEEEKNNEINFKQSEVQEWIGKHKKLEEKIVVLEGQLKKDEATEEDIKSKIQELGDLKEKYSELEEKITTLTEQVEEADSNKLQLESECNEKIALISEMSEKQGELERKVSSLTEELERSQTAERKISRSVAGKEKQLSVKQGEISSWVRKYDSLEQRILELEVQVSELDSDKNQLKQTLSAREGEIAQMKKKAEDGCDIDAMDIKNRLKEYSLMEKDIKSKMEELEKLKQDVDQLSTELDKEKLMNKKNRELMDEMQLEVRAARKSKQEAEASQVTAEGKIKNIEANCEQKIRNEKLMNDKNREIMNSMQREVRKERAERAIYQTKVIDAESRIKSLEKELDEVKEENGSLHAQMEDLVIENENINLKHALASFNDAFSFFQDNDTEILQKLSAKEDENADYKEEVADLKKIISEKDANISALENALGEELQRADSFEQRLGIFSNKEVADFSIQKLMETFDMECQKDVDFLDFSVQSDLQPVICEEKHIQATVSMVNFEVQNVPITDQLLIQTELTDAGITEQLSNIETLNEKLEEANLLHEDTREQLRSTRETNEELSLTCSELKTSVTLLENEKQRLELARDTLQTELDIQVESRQEIDSVIEDKEKSYLELIETLEVEKMEKEGLQRELDTAAKGISELEAEVQDMGRKLTSENKFCTDLQSAFTKYQEETNDVIRSLNDDLKQSLLNQAKLQFSMNGVDSDDSSGDDLGLPSAPLNRCRTDEMELNLALQETKYSIKALIKANSKLCKQIEKLSSEKEAFFKEQDNYAQKIKLLQQDNERLISVNKALEVELIEKDALVEEQEEMAVVLRRELENQSLMYLKKSPLDQGTLTDLHNLRYRCFMVIPSDPAREILHMFVSQYRDNLCSNCYARITTLGSTPCTPRRSGASAKSTTYSDIMLQTDYSLIQAGSDSAYSSSVSIQTDKGEQGTEVLRMRNCQLLNDLTDIKKSEHELEMALKYQLKVNGEAQKKVNKLEKREKLLQDKVLEYQRWAEELQSTLDSTQQRYQQLLICQQGLKTAVNTSTDLSEKLHTEIKEIRNIQRTSPTLRASTPGVGDISTTDPSLLHLSPIQMGGLTLSPGTIPLSKSTCDREIDTMSPLIITWADNTTQTDVEDEASMLQVQEELIKVKEQLKEKDESNVDIEEELRRVLELQEKERQEMQDQVTNLASHFKTELDKAKSDKHLAEEALNRSIETIAEGAQMLSQEHDNSLKALRDERDILKQKLDEAVEQFNNERDQIVKERNELETQYFDYKIKAAAEKESLSESYNANVQKLDKAEKEMTTMKTSFEQDISDMEQKLKESDDMKVKFKEMSMINEQLKNKLQEYMNKDEDNQEKNRQNTRIISALKEDVLETRARLEALAGCDLKKQQAEERNKDLCKEAESLKVLIDKLNAKNSKLLSEAKELKESIEQARAGASQSTSSETQTRPPATDYTSPAMASVALLWYQEREEHLKLKSEIALLNTELEDIKIENIDLETSVKELSEVKSKLNTSESERGQLRNKLTQLQEQKIELENDRESAKEHLNKIMNQLDIVTNDKQNLLCQLQKHDKEKDRLLEDLNVSFKENANKTRDLEDCLQELAKTQDELFAVKEELIKNRKEEEKLKESLKQAQQELDNLEANVNNLRKERDLLNDNNLQLKQVDVRFKAEKEKSFKLVSEIEEVKAERDAIEKTAEEERDKLQRDIADILDAFEEYKSKTTGAPEKIFELKKGMAILQDTLHQIMNTNVELTKSNANLTATIEQLNNDNLVISQERDEIKDQLESGMIDLSKSMDSPETKSILNEMEKLRQRTQRFDKYENDNGVLKRKVRKMQELLREKENELINLRDVADDITEFEKENVSLRKQLTLLRQKTEKYNDANVVLKDKIRELEEEAAAQSFMASTPNQTTSFAETSIGDEVSLLRMELERLRKESVRQQQQRSHLTADSRVSVAQSQVSTMESAGLSEKCKTLEIELNDMKDRYRILKETHDAEQLKAIELADALRNSIKLLKSYIDRSGDVKGSRMTELQAQLDDQRMQLFEHFGLDVSQPINMSISQFQPEPDNRSLASHSASTVCLEPTDSQLI